MQTITYLPVSELYPHPDNPRKDLGDLEELTESIKAKGILQNLTVVKGHRQTGAEFAKLSAQYRVNPTEELRQKLNCRYYDDGYTVIIGHRRLGGARRAGLTEVPCVIVEMTLQEQIETMLVENVQRSDLTVYEQAEGFQMMLNMGGTIDEVSQKTGFSKSTVRNRVKLLDLDKKKFQEASLRGGTMQDYLQLSKIKNEERRNKVLDTIGTANFNNELKNAMEEEETEAYLEKVRATLEASDWCQNIEHDTPANSSYGYFASYDKWNRAEVTRPKDADTAQYFYQVKPHGVYIYKKRDEAVEEHEEDPAAKRRERLIEELCKINEQLNKISTIHLEMRKDFVRDFNKVATHDMDIQAFAAKVLAHICSNYGYSKTLNVELLGSLLNIPVNDNDELDAAAWKSHLFNRPCVALLCASYATLEKSGQQYNAWSYDKKIKANRPAPKEANTDLDMVYELLCSLDYEMSDEEIQMQKGTHPLYKEAEDLIEAYLKEETE